MTAGIEEGRVVHDGEATFRQVGETIDGYSIYHATFHDSQWVRAFPVNEEPHFGDFDMKLAVDVLHEETEGSKLSVQWVSDTGVLDFANQFISFSQGLQPSFDNDDIYLHGAFTGDLFSDWQTSPHDLVTSDILDEEIKARTPANDSELAFIEIAYGEVGSYWGPEVIAILTPLEMFGTENGTERTRELFTATRDMESGPSVKVFDAAMQYGLILAVGTPQKSNG